MKNTLGRARLESGSSRAARHLALLIRADYLHATPLRLPRFFHDDRRRRPLRDRNRELELSFHLLVLCTAQYPVQVPSVTRLAHLSLTPRPSPPNTDGRPLTGPTAPDLEKPKKQC